MSPPASRSTCCLSTAWSEARRDVATGFTPTFVQAWWLLAAAIVFEIAGTVCMRLSDGLTHVTPSVLIFVFYAVSFALNTFVVRTLGLWYFREPATALKLASIGLVVIGVLGVHAGSR